MTQTSIQFKEAIITKALSLGDIALQQIASENNVGCSTLQKWLRLQREGLPLSGGRRGRPLKGQGQTPPLQHLVATAGLDEQGVGAYCREQGIHSFQLKQWQAELMQHNGSKSQSQKESSELKKLRNENKQLKKDLLRKDKALAETTALLVLKKKADLIWGESEDD